ncbi:hypothetical protein DPMN_017262 [Dreissena polymorpha]|uniref:Uncharacterized protein n=1 Tax=Dreissena polymorpha TaxID=45954 RepID=A0A9D4NB24_DREPO|nr:hypothetical protein DPMN_017262 [Dreissena polymorpha]
MNDRGSRVRFLALLLVAGYVGRAMNYRGSRVRFPTLLLVAGYVGRAMNYRGSRVRFPALLLVASSVCYSNELPRIAGPIPGPITCG